MRILVVFCSLNPDSRSAVLAEQAVAALRGAGTEVEALDLRTLDLPFCDAGAAYGHPDTHRVQQAVGAADAILLAVPIYNYDVNAAAKNLIELTGKAWSGKAVAFLCAAGGRGSFMSVMPLANSLMLDFRCLILPRFVYVTGQDFDEEGNASTDVTRRVDELCVELTQLTTALATAGHQARVSRPLG